MKKQLTFGIIALLAMVFLAACTNNNDSSPTNDETNEQEEMNHEEMDHEGMDHSSDGEIPEGLEKADEPTYAVGSTVTIKNGHMEGMEGAEAKIVGAYNTTAYAVNYTPTSGGDPVKNHKWIIHEELEEPGEAPLREGETAVTTADHMEGMKGAEVDIASSEDTTVYMIDYTPTNGVEKVKNHKWVTEAELER